MTPPVPPTPGGGEERFLTRLRASLKRHKPILDCLAESESDDLPYGSGQGERIAREMPDLDEYGRRSGWWK